MNYQCEFCHRKARESIGAGRGEWGFWCCGIHANQTRNRIDGRSFFGAMRPSAMMTRSELRAAMGFLKVDAPPHFIEEA